MFIIETEDGREAPFKPSKLKRCPTLTLENIMLNSGFEGQSFIWILKGEGRGGVTPVFPPYSVSISNLNIDICLRMSVQ